MKWIGIVIGLSFGAFLETAYVKLPFVLIVLLLTLIFIQKPWTIFFSIPAGLLLDSLSFRLVGESSVFFAVMMGLFFLYGKKFEIQSIGFVIFASLVSSVSYFLLFGSEALIFQTVFSVGISLFLFVSLSLLGERLSSKKDSYLWK